MSDFTQLLRKTVNGEDLPATYGMEKWINEGSIVTAEAQEIVNAVMLEDNTLGRGGEGRFRPSLIGYGCNRAQLFSFLDKPQDERNDSKSQMVMSAGTWSHYRWQTAGLSAGWLADIEVKVSYEPWHLRGAMDGLLSDGSGFELKTTGDRSYKFTTEPKESHLIQIHAYMRALNIDKFSLVYENRDSLQHKEFRITRDPAVDWQLDVMFNALNGHLEQESLPEMLSPCIEKNTKNFQYNYCNWQSSCPTAQFKNTEN
jgi:hypothetical protein